MLTNRGGFCFRFPRLLERREMGRAARTGWFFIVLLTALAAGSAVCAQRIGSPALELPDSSVLSGVPRVYVRRFRFEGNTAFSEAELAAVTASFVGRELSLDELEEARRAVSLHYINHGFVNSGAVINDQPVGGGIITLTIVEGRLTEMHLTGNKWLCEDYIRARVEQWSVSPLNVNQLRSGLQLLRQNPNVSQVNAELQPGPVPGEAVLNLKVIDRQPFRFEVLVDNARPPSVGSVEFLVRVADINLTGHSDPLEFIYGIADGGNDGFSFSELDNLEVSYARPVTHFDTTLQVQGSKKDFALIEEPLAQLDIVSESHTYGVSLRQPFYWGSSR